MDFDSPDVEKEFPGLYASEEPGSKGKKDEGKYKNESLLTMVYRFLNFMFLKILIIANEGEHEKVSKKDLLIGRRKEKKDKKCYAALGDEDDDEPIGEASSR